MSTTAVILYGCATLLLIGLGAYAARLWYLVWQQQQAAHQQQIQQANALRQHQLGLLEDINFLARSVLSEQCEITEGILRLHHIIHGLEPAVWELEELSTVRAHYEATQAMPILAAYKALSKQQQFRLDNERWALEEANKAAIQRELTWLLSYPFPTVTLIHP